MVRLFFPHSLGFKVFTWEMCFQTSFGNSRFQSLCPWMTTLITKLIYKRFVLPVGNALRKLTQLSPLKETLLGLCPQKRVPVHGSCGDNTNSSALRSERNKSQSFIENFVLVRWSCPSFCYSAFCMRLFFARNCTDKTVNLKLWILLGAGTAQKLNNGPRTKWA